MRRIERLPSFCRRLHSTSLDELLEFFNILEDDLAVAGSRPLLVKYISSFNARQARRHKVRPGFTGLVQTRGRNAISWEEMFDWDVKYVDHITFTGDVKRIMDTLKTVVERDSISAAGEATMRSKGLKTER